MAKNHLLHEIPDGIQLLWEIIYASTHVFHTGAQSLNL